MEVSKMTKMEEVQKLEEEFLKHKKKLEAEIKM